MSDETKFFMFGEVIARRPASTRWRRFVCWARDYHVGDMDAVGAFCSTCGRPVDPS